MKGTGAGSTVSLDKTPHIIHNKRMELTCLNCRNEFTVGSQTTKIYCSERCRIKAEKKRWLKAHRARFWASEAGQARAAELAEQKRLWAEAREARRKPPRTPKPKPIKKAKLTIIERLEQWSMSEPNSGCLLWLGHLSVKGGYATIKIGERSVRVNRLAYEVWRGSIPEGALICHTCDTPACIEPNHLYAGTYQTNADDMMRRGRWKSSWVGRKKPLPKFAGDGI
jgi:hypothetical protein